MKEIKVFRNRLGAERVRDTLMRSGIPCSIIQLRGVHVNVSGSIHADPNDFAKKAYVTRYSVNVPDDLYEEGVWTLRDVGTPLPFMEYMFPMVKKIRRKKYVQAHEQASQVRRGDSPTSFDADGSLGAMFEAATLGESLPTSLPTSPLSTENAPPPLP